jgi:hypothetical protein
MTAGWSRRVADPDGRDVVFDAGSHLHLAEGARPWILDHVDTVMAAVASPDFREDDPLPGRERFYRAGFPADGLWLRVVLDFNDDPAWVVTALVQRSDPRLRPR